MNQLYLANNYFHLKICRIFTFCFHLTQINIGFYDSPNRKIEQLDQSSTMEDREIYRFQLAQKLFASSLKNNNKKVSDQFKTNTPSIKLSKYNTIDYFPQTDRLF